MSKPRIFSFGFSLVVSLILFRANARSQTYTFTSIDFPGAAES